MNSRFRFPGNYLAAAFFAAAAGGVAAQPNGKPFTNLQEQIDAFSSGGETTIHVQCGGGSTPIADALASAPDGGVLVIVIDGVCAENVVIQRDRVTLAGAGPLVSDAVIQGPERNRPGVHINGARGVTIVGLTVRRGQTSPIGRDSTGEHGIQVTNSGAVKIVRSEVSEHHDNGISVEQNSDAVVVDSTIKDNNATGVLATLSSSATISGSTIDGNGLYGVLINEASAGRIADGNTIRSLAPTYFTAATIGVYRGSSLRIRGENELRNDAPRTDSPVSGEAGGFVLDVEVGSTVRQDSGLTTFVGHIESFNLSTVDLRQANISGNIYVDAFGQDAMTNVRLRGSTMQGTVYVPRGGFDVRNNVRLNGKIDCRGGTTDQFSLPQFVDIVGAPVSIEDGIRNCATDLDVQFLLTENGGRVGLPVVLETQVTNFSQTIPAEDVTVFVVFDIFGSPSTFAATGGVCTLVALNQATCEFSSIPPGGQRTITARTVPTDSGLLKAEAFAQRKTDGLPFPFIQDLNESNDHQRLYEFIQPAEQPITPSTLPFFLPSVPPPHSH